MFRISVVIATRDRRAQLLEALEHLSELPERPEIIVVDNASGDGTPGAVGRSFPAVRVVALDRNLGAVARNVGVARAGHDYVAFADDDSWWEAGSLAAATRIFDAHPRLALLAGRILVGPSGRLDPVSAFMASNPLGTPAGPPGPEVLGFLACGAIVRKEAFLACGGFDPVTFFMGEEERLAYDLAAAGWEMAYCDELVARHHPRVSREPAEKRRLQARNAALTAWMRRGLPVAFGATWRSFDYRPLRTLRELGFRLPWAISRRRTPCPSVEAKLKLLG